MDIFINVLIMIGGFLAALLIVLLLVAIVIGVYVKIMQRSSKARTMRLNVVIILVLLAFVLLIHFGCVCLSLYFSSFKPKMKKEAEKSTFFKASRFMILCFPPCPSAGVSPGPPGRQAAFRCPSDTAAQGPCSGPSAGPERTAVPR